MTRQKGATKTDKILWQIYDRELVRGCTWNKFSETTREMLSANDCWRYNYCEEGLYALYHMCEHALYLIEAGSPAEALDKILNLRKECVMCQLEGNKVV